ncbi:conserved uncharacterized protein [Desulfococcus multivorans]|nr:conserved uncharacterized protein [Desulfococcus multivorans]
MVLRVLDALSAAESIGNQILCGPGRDIVDGNSELAARIASGRIRWIGNKATPSTSACHAMQSLSPGTPVLLTTADHALLKAFIVDHFCAEAQRTGCDIVAALARRDDVTAAYPETRRTAYRLGGTAYCSCNLFAFLTPGGRNAADFWRRVENLRKNPFRVVNAFGWISTLRYLTARLTLSEALGRASRVMGLKVGAVVMPYPEAAIDVDSVSDWRIAESIVSRNMEAGRHPDDPPSP